MAAQLRRTTNPDALAASPYPFQAAGIRWLSGARCALLGDEMGTGKSLQAIRAADAVEARRVLVLAPTNAIFNWRNEFRKFSLFDRRVQVVDAGSVRVDPTTDVVVTTHGLIRNADIRRRVVEGGRFDALVVDEAHAFKHGKSERTRALYGTACAGGADSLVYHADRAWLLSGTPIENHAGELWTHLRALRPDLIPSEKRPGKPMTFDEFTGRYCVVIQSLYGPKPIGNRKDRLPEIREIIRTFVLRRRLAEVLPDLPPIRFDLVTMPATESLSEDFKRIEAEIGPSIQAALAEIDAAPGDDAYAKLAALSHHENEEGSLARLRRLTGLLKVRPTVEMLDEQFTARPGGKVIVFGYHLQPIEDLVAACRERGWNPVKVDGSVTALDRQARVDRFQSDPSCLVFVGQLRACATAATLTAAQDVIFMESSWVPTENAQAAARARRIGQTQFVRVRFLALAGSIDEAVVTVLARKVQSNRELLG